MGKPNSFSLGDVLDDLEPFQPVAQVLDDWSEQLLRYTPTPENRLRQFLAYHDLNKEMLIQVYALVPDLSGDPGTQLQTASSLTNTHQCGPQIAGRFRLGQDVHGLVL